MFSVFEEPLKKKKGKEFCKLNFCGLENTRWLRAKSGSFPIRGAEETAPEQKAQTRRPLSSMNSRVGRTCRKLRFEDEM